VRPGDHPRVLGGCHHGFGLSLSRPPKEALGTIPATVVTPVGSQLKKAHKTHALAQPAGVAYPHESVANEMPDSPSGQAERLFAELCQLVPSAPDRAAKLGVPVEQDEAWRNGRQLPILRAHRKTLAAALADLRTQ
jgi:hypothetical protein